MLFQLFDTSIAELPFQLLIVFSSMMKPCLEGVKRVSHFPFSGVSFSGVWVLKTMQKPCKTIFFEYSFGSPRDRPKILDLSIVASGGC